MSDDDDHQLGSGSADDQDEAGERCQTGVAGWRVGLGDSGQRLRPMVGDLLCIALPETPSTGFAWVVDDAGVVDRSEQAGQQLDARIAFATIEQSSSDLAAFGAPSCDGEPTPLVLGAGGVRHLTVRLLRPGRFVLRLTQRRPWDPTTIVDVFELFLTVSPAGTVAEIGT